MDLQRVQDNSFINLQMIEQQFNKITTLAFFENALMALPDVETPRQATSTLVIRTATRLLEASAPSLRNYVSSSLVESVCLFLGRFALLNPTSEILRSESLHHLIINLLASRVCHRPSVGWLGWLVECIVVCSNSSVLYSTSTSLTALVGCCRYLSDPLFSPVPEAASRISRCIRIILKLNISALAAFNEISEVHNIYASLASEAAEEVFETVLLLKLNNLSIKKWTRVLHQFEPHLAAKNRKRFDAILVAEVSPPTPTTTHDEPSVDESETSSHDESRTSSSLVLDRRLLLQALRRHKEMEESFVEYDKTFWRKAQEDGEYFEGRINHILQECTLNAVTGDASGTRRVRDQLETKQFSSKANDCPPKPPNSAGGVASSDEHKE